MPSERPRPSRASWNPRAGRSAAAEASLRYKWRREPAARSARPARRLATTLAVLAYLGFSGLLVWVALWLWPPRPAELVLIGAGYQTNLAIPHNAYGRRSLDDLAALGRRRASSWLWPERRIRLVHEVRKLHTGGAWDKDLAGLSGPSVILMLAVHGGADARGAYLLADDASASPLPDGRDRLRLEAVLDRLAALPAGLNKLLVLDATGIDGHPPLGLIRNEFARELAALDGRIARIPNLVVLSASGPDQRSWPIEEYGRTAFAHFLIEGLEGATGALDRSTHRVNALSLFRFVRDGVGRWALANRGAVQTPILLPAGPEGLARAGRIELAVANGAYEPPHPEVLPAFAMPAKLGVAWRTFARLEAQVPPPETYSPRAWSHYRAALLRYEQLLLAGDRRSARAMAEVLATLEHQIEAGRTLSLGSEEGALAMPAVAGRPLGEPGPAQQRRFNELWEAPEAEAAPRWAKLRAETADDEAAEVTAFRLQFADFLLGRAARDPSADLARAARLVRVLDDPNRLRPAEAHFLAMLDRDLPSTPPPPPDQVERLGRALRLRRAAERAALAARDGGPSYSEQVEPWIRSLVEAADRDRQVGQDLLFATDARSWAEADLRLAAAEANVRRASAAADAVRPALSLRDEMLAWLPGLSTWLEDQDDAMVKEVEALWAEVHDLARTLDHPDLASIEVAPPPSPESPHPRSLAARVAAVREGRDRLKERFARDLLAALGGKSPAAWRTLDAALGVPFADLAMPERIEHPVRPVLLAERTQVAQQLLLNSSREDAAPGAGPVSAEAHATEEDRARRRGRLALAALGRPWFDACPGTPEGRVREEFDQVHELLDGTPTGPRRNGSLALALAGDQIAHRRRGLAGAIVARLAERHPRPPADQLAIDYRESDHLARLLDGAGAATIGRHLAGSVAPSLALDPSRGHRRILARNLLVRQARRTLEDHWAAEDPAADPYYRTAGLTMLDDARALDPRGEGAEMLQLALTRPDGLRLEAPGRGGGSETGRPDVVATSERQFWVDYVVRADQGDGPGPGEAVFWLEPAEHLHALVPEAGRRLVRSVGATAEVALRCQVESPLLLRAEEEPPPAPRVERTALALHGLYRGQRLERSASVELHPKAERTAVVHPRPAAAALAVRADDVFDRLAASDGAVAIVLDCSGSLGGEDPNSSTPPPRYLQATGALRAVLGQIPRGTDVSLWAFGQRVPGAESKADAEKTVRQIQRPTAWDPDDPALVQGLMSKVEYPALMPWNESPIVRTMLAARADLVAVEGFKTLLVLTDGMDNRFAGDTQANPEGQPIPQALREAFLDSGIEILIASFRAVVAEEEVAREQFSVIESFPVRGKFFSVDEPDELAAALRSVLRQELRYRVVREDHAPIPGRSSPEVSVSRLGENDRWYPEAIPPGGYSLRIRAREPLATPIALNGGDLLLVTLRGTAEGVDFERTLYSRDAFPFAPARELMRQGPPWDGWRLAVLRDERPEAEALHLLATLEKLPTAREVPLRQTRPREVWFEVIPGGDSPPPPLALRWADHPGVPAPAFDLDVPRWPLEAAAEGAEGPGPPSRPVLRAWWNPDEPTPPEALAVAGVHYRIEAPPEEVRAAALGDSGVTVESVLVEDRTVEVAPGRREPRPCLVVRLAYPEGRPVWARPQGIDPPGQEHRYYEAARKYTGIFWPVTEDQARAKVRQVAIVSVAAFQAACARKGFVVEGLELESPEPGRLPPPALGPTRTADLDESPADLLPLPPAGGD